MADKLPVLERLKNVYEAIKGAAPQHVKPSMDKVTAQDVLDSQDLTAQVLGSLGLEVTADGQHVGLKPDQITYTPVNFNEIAEDDQFLTWYSKTAYLNTPKADEAARTKRLMDYDFMYSNCLGANTKISLASGEEVRVADLIGKKFFVYAFDTKTNKIVITDGCSARVTGTNKIWEVTLDNGEVVECTSDHPWLIRSGTYKKTKDLVNGESLIPLYRAKDDLGYELVFNTVTLEFIPTHILSDEYNLSHDVYSKSRGSVRHHVDFNKLNNSPDNIQRLSWYEHHKVHENLLKDRWSDLEWRKKMLSIQSHNGTKSSTIHWKDPEFRSKMVENNSKTQKEVWSDPEYKAAMMPRIISNGVKVANNLDQQVIRQRSIIVRVAKKILEHGGDILNWNSEVSRLYKEGILHSTQIRYFNRVEQYFGSLSTLQQVVNQPTNHKVVSVRETDRVETVYDITVPDYHNFALSAGVFVHNSAETALAVDTYVDETLATVPPDKAFVDMEVWKDGIIDKELTKFLNEAIVKTKIFHYTEAIIENMVKYGDHFVIMRPKGSNEDWFINPLTDCKKFKRENFPYTDIPKQYKYQLINSKTKDLPPWEVVHFRILTTDPQFMPYGKSMIERMRSSYKQLLINEAILALSRASKIERLVIYVPIAGTSPETTFTKLMQARTLFKNAIFGDSGAMKGKNRPPALTDVLFMPTSSKGDGDYRLDRVGSTIDIASVDDVQYFLSKMYVASRIPASYYAADSQNQYDGFKKLQLLDLKFARVINKVQKSFATGMVQMGAIMLAFAGKWNADLEIKASYTGASPIESAQFDTLTNSINLAVSLLSGIMQTSGRQQLPLDAISAVLKQMTPMPAEFIDTIAMIVGANPAPSMANPEQEVPPEEVTTEPEIQAAGSEEESLKKPIKVNDYIKILESFKAVHKSTVSSKEMWIMNASTEEGKLKQIAESFKTEIEKEMK
jgi:hypothetical protein